MLPKIIKLINNTKAIFKIDSEPTKGSNNLVTSGGVYKALENSANSTVSPFIALQENWNSGSSVVKNLEDVTVNTLPELQNYSDTFKYMLQLPSLWVLIPTGEGRKIRSIFCTLGQTTESRSEGLFIWKPNEEAPFTQIEASRGLGSPSWRWFIKLPSPSKSEGQTV